MKKLSKRILAALLAVLLVAGCGFGAYQVYRSNFGGAVAVYSMDNFAMTDYYEDNPEYDGEVTTEGMQAVTLSDTQTVQEVMVQVGDQVKTGDPLFSYDSTLTEIDLQKQALSLQQLELDLIAAKKELKTISSYRPGVAIPGSKSSGGTVSSFASTVEDEEEVVPTVEGLELLEGDGTEEAPYVYDWQESFSYTTLFITAAMQGDREAFVTFRLDGETLQLMNGDVPLEPEEPTDHTDPDTPTEPTEPDTPDDPDEPTEPDVPDEPDTPAEPDEPTEPDAPIEPETPDVPEEPTEPETPDEPDPSGGDQEDSSTESGDGSATVEGLSARSTAGYAVSLSAAGGEEDGEPQEPDEPTDPGNESDPDPEPDASQPDDGDSSEAEEPEEVNYALSWTIQFQRTGTECQYQLISIHIGGDTETDGVTQKIADPLPPLEDEDCTDTGADDWFADSYEDPGIVYTRAELNEMLQAQEQTVKNLDLQLRQGKLAYKKLENELNNSAVYSELDGVVSYIGEETETGSTYMKIYAGGGYVVRVGISELVLDSVEIGQTVTVNDYYSGSVYEGTVKAISEFPSSDGGWYGNTNASYYPVTVAVDQSEDLEEYNWVGVQLMSQEETSNTFYLENAFLRTENGRSYVYVQGDDGTLERRWVSVGKSLWGSYTEIKSGVAMDELIAFPYGKNVREGAATREGSVDELYGY
ncbi:MAG: HlyD family efflux transporter periplasmic adaptor subunit [Clostridiales bacterium]|nr:HlyD family efflux transporter periplasmic adaptor subunit [Clostridiales bacterium]